jgi:hypothetical protein
MHKPIRINIFGKPLKDVFDVVRHHAIPLEADQIPTGVSFSKGFSLRRAWIKRKDGSEHVFLESVASLVDAHGLILGKAFVFQDSAVVRKREHDLIDAGEVDSETANKIDFVDIQIAQEFDQLLESIQSVTKSFIEAFQSQIQRLGWAGCYEEAEKHSQTLAQKLLLLEVLVTVRQLSHLIEPTQKGLES